MTRTQLMVSSVLASAMLVPAAQAQAQDHAVSHSHASPPVECTTLATPPWVGLDELDRERFAAAQRSVVDLSTPEAAMAAGFRPALGDIPGMGVHYVSADRSRDGIYVDQPDHLMFAPVDGEEKLVGAAYAFIDVPDTDEPLPFDSDLAHWHDHPQFAPEGQTLHMLHLWFIPSSHGPFAGLNFWLPYHGVGITPPNACWTADPETLERIQRVAFALVPAENPLSMRVDSAGGFFDPEHVSDQRVQILEDLDAAAKQDDHRTWSDAADRFLADLTPREQTRMTMLLRMLGQAQMSSAQRAGIGG